VFSGRFAVGGGGFTLVENVEIPGSAGGTGFELGMGYGGVFLQLWHPIPGGFSGELGLLAGAGNAEVRDLLMGSELGADNFLVLEPTLSASRPAFRGVRVGVSLGYRKVWGVEDLLLVTGDDLQSVTGTLFLRIGGP
jgi:hypothetical protein